MSIYAAINGYMDEIPVADVNRYETELLAFMPERYPDVVEAIRNEKAVSKEMEPRLKGAVEDFSAQFQPTKETGMVAA